MIDYGTRQTDLAVKRTEWRLSRVYRQAQRDIDEKLKDWQKRHEEREKRYRQQLADGKITQADFDAWMRGQVFQDKQWQARKAEIDRILLNADREAQRIVNEGKIGVFADNANYIGYDLERNGNVNTGFTLYDQNMVGRLIKSDPQILPKPAPGVQKDKAYTYYNKLMNSAITQGIVQGETIPQIAKRIVDKTGESSYASAVRNARTAYTGAQNAGRMEGLHQAQRLGIKVKKKWLATLDSRTRDAHADLDGQIQEVDDPFESELGDIMYPGDPTAEPGNVYNCFVGETNIATDSEIIRSYKHDYSGKLITVKTSSGVEFTCTPNHPILTPSGWVAAERLQDRNNLLIASIGEDDPLRINPYIEHAFTRIDAIHQLFDEMGSKRTARLGVNFHGDVPTTDVEIITQKRFLRNNRDSGCADGVNKLLLKHSDESLMGKGAFVQHFGSVWFATLRFVGSFSKALSFFGRRVIHAVVHGFRPIARRDATVLQAQADNVAGDVQFLRKRLDGFTGKVFADNIVNIEITTVSHVPVYNLQTGNSRYFVNSIIAQNGEKCNGNFAIAHNCRCTLVYVYPDYPSEMERRDNETGEIVGDMTYREWEAMKRGEGEVTEPENNNEPQTGSETDDELERFGSALQGASNAAEFWMNMDADQMDAFNASGENIYDFYNRLHDKASPETLEMPEWKPNAPGGVSNYQLSHDYSASGIDVNQVPARSDGWMAGAETTGIINVREGGFDDWQYVIGHEAGHQLANYNPELQRTIVDNPGGLLGRYNQKRGFFDGAFGEYNAEEAWADAVSSYVNSPRRFQEQYPELYDAVDGFFKSSPSARDFIDRTYAAYRRAVGL